MSKPSREASKRETRDALIMAGLSEFAEKGLDLPSLDAISARAGFTRGAFYVHFRDRDEFLHAVMDRVFQLFIDAILVRDDAAHDLEHTIDRFATAVALRPAPDGDPLAGIAIHKIADACNRSAELRARFVTLVEGAFGLVAAATAQAQQAGTVRADLSPAGAGQVLSLLALGVLTALDFGIPLDPERARETVRRLLSIEGQ